MPLFQPEGNHYLKRTRVYVDTDDRDQARSKSQFDFVIELNALFENVVSLELVDYNIKRDLQQTFMSANGRFGGNTKIDVFMDDTATFSNPYSFTVTIPPRDYATVTELASDLQTLLNNTMDAGGNAFHNTGSSVSWTVTAVPTVINPDGNDRIDSLRFDVEQGAGSNTIFAQFKFFTGDNSADSAGYTLGFPEGSDSNPYIVRDLGGGAIITFAVPTVSEQVKLTNRRYVDIYSDQFPELKPISRISLEDDIDTVQNFDANDKPRLLTNPVKRLQDLRIRMVLPPDDRPPLENSIGGFDLVFDILQVRGDINIPQWVKQGLTYL